MDLLVALRPIRLTDGDLLNPGDMFTTNEVEKVIDRGYARRLTHEENERLLDAYIAEAKNVFRFPTARARKAHEQPGLWDEDKKGIQ